MSAEKQYSVTYRFDNEPQVFKWAVEATDPRHAEEVFTWTMWMYANHDDWRSPELHAHRLESLQIIGVRPEAGS